MREMWLSSVFALTLMASTPAWAQDTGFVAGQVLDQANAITLPGVPVEVVDTGDIAYTDIDGHYRLELPAGSYQVRITMAGYAEQTVQVDVVAGELTNLQVALPTNVFADEVVVTAPALDAESNTAAAQMLMRMRAPTVQDNIGRLEMRQNDDSTAADAMQRVTGVSVVDNSYIYVRGLGERYSSTTLAGVTLPTTEPDKRVVPLDLFPAGLIDSVQVNKTYNPDQPAQFAGGLVEILPMKLPSESSFTASVTGGWNSITTGNPFLSYPGGGNDWLGFDDGRRSLPASIPDRKVIRGGRFTPEVGFLQSELTTLGQSFENVWDPNVNDDARLNQSYQATYGGRWDKLGFVGTMRQAQRQRTVEETRTFYNVGSGDALERFNGPYTFDIGSSQGNLGGVGNLAYQINANHRVAIDNFYTNIGRDEARTFEGFNSDARNDIRNTRLFWVEEQINSHNLNGDHLFPGVSNSVLDWSVSYSRAKRDEPDLRETLYEFSHTLNAYRLADESQSGLRMFNDLLDDSTRVAANWSTVFQNWDGMATQIKFGGSYIDRGRDFSSRRFRYSPIGTQGVDLTQEAETLFTAQSFEDRVFQLREETRPTDTYAAASEIGAFYGMVDLPLSARLRLVTGARVEQFRQTVDTFDPFARSVGFDSQVISSTIDEVDLFPSANLVYAVQHDQNVRLAVSRTVNRPEFRELAPFEFTDVVGGRATVGNPDLVQSLITNVDARWEWFAGPEEVIATSFFYKDFQDPIERIVEPTSQLRTSFTNAESARNFGFEVEARRQLTEIFFAGVNYTWVDSEVTLSPEAQQVQTSLTRPLAGTSDNLFNAMFEVRTPNGFSGRVLWNFFSERIIDVGSLGLPDILEDDRHSLDLVFTKRWDAYSLKLAISNLTNEDYLFTQGGLAQRFYNLGRTVDVGVSFHP